MEPRDLPWWDDEDFWEAVYAAEAERLEDAASEGDADAAMTLRVARGEEPHPDTVAWCAQYREGLATRFGVPLERIPRESAFFTTLWRVPHTRRELRRHIATWEKQG